MIRVLHTLPALDGGGAEKIIYEYCIRMTKEFHFDYIVHSDRKGILEEKLTQIGSKIYHIPSLHTNRRENIKRINSIIKNGNYDIIHVSQGYKGVHLLWIAKKYGVPVRIAHSHMAYIQETYKERAIRLIASVMAKQLSTALFSCGEDATRWMWGVKSNAYIMTNAIDSKRYSFNPEMRLKIRRQLGIDDNKTVIGNVARFAIQKNHEFIIDIAKSLPNKQDVVFLLVGRGELYEMIKKKVIENDLNNVFLFTGVRSDVNDLLSAMDIFILPSRFEGFPVTIIEAQANGLCCIVSENVTHDVKMAQNIYYLPINQGCHKWVELISSIEQTHLDNSISMTRYDIYKSVEALEDKYKELLRNENQL